MTPNLGVSQAHTAPAPDPAALSTRRRDSLQVRFMIVVIAGAALFAIGAGLLAYQMGHERGLENGNSTIAAMVDAVEKTAAIGAYTADRVLLQEVADGLSRNPLVARVELRSSSGALLASHRTAGAPEAEDNTADKVQVTRALVSPFDANERVGELVITADSRRLEAVARSEALTPTALLVGQTALIALLLYVVASRLVTQPIVRLGRELRGLLPGTSERLATPPAHANDELGTMIASANALLLGTELALQRERDMRAAVEKMEAQYRQIFDSSSAGIFVLDPQGKLINGNPTMLKIIGLPADQMKHMQGNDFVRRVFARPERVQALIAEAMIRGETVSADLELVQAGIAPRWAHCLISVQGTSNGTDVEEVSLIEGVMYDITERIRVEHDVRHLAEHDALTGLKNRFTGDSAIDRFFADAQAGHSTVTLLYIDLDGFKRVNDTLGHKAGDQVLVQCALRLQAAVRRGSDLVFRAGGDEFVIAMPFTGSSDLAACNIAAALLASVQAPIVLDDGSTVGVGASIGMACFPRHGVTRKQVLTAADTAMYEVKRSGKNGYAMALDASPIA